jgi:hypothetical protein
MHIANIKNAIAECMIAQAINEDAIDLFEDCANIMHFLAYATNECILDNDDYDTNCEFDELGENALNLRAFGIDIMNDLNALI